MKKQILGIILLAALAVLMYFMAGYIVEQWKAKPDEQEQIIDQRENIKDEILHYSDLEKLHADSAQFYHQKANASYKEYITVVADTSGWNSLRATYKRNLETKIRAGFAGQRDSLRVP